jgi:hypothetical protein
LIRFSFVKFEVVLECCHKVDTKTEVVICGRSLPGKNEVKTLIFPKDDIVEIIALDVDKEFAIKCELVLKEVFNK